MNCKKVCSTLMLTLLLITHVACRQTPTAGEADIISVPISKDAIEIADGDHLGSQAESTQGLADMLANADEHVNKQEYDEAIRLYQEAMQPGPLSAQACIRLARLHNKLGYRATALDVLETGALAFGGSNAPQSEDIMTEWWNIITDTSDVPQQGLRNDEITQIEDLAYLICGSPFAFAQERPKKNLLFMLHIYYDTFSKYKQKPYELYYDSTLAYYPDAIITSEEWTGALLTPERANAFVYDLMGVEIPELYGEHGVTDNAVIYGYDYISFRDGMYYFELGDYINCTYFVEGYRYLGDGMFYVILGEDWRETPGPPEDTQVCYSDAVHMILRRSASPCGFTAVSLPKNTPDTILREGWKPPSEMTWVAD